MALQKAWRLMISFFLSPAILQKKEALSYIGKSSAEFVSTLFINALLVLVRRNVCLLFLKCPVAHPRTAFPGEGTMGHADESPPLIFHIILQHALFIIEMPILRSS